MQYYLRQLIYLNKTGDFDRLRVILEEIKRLNEEQEKAQEITQRTGISFWAQ